MVLRTCLALSPDMTLAIYNSINANAAVTSFADFPKCTREFSVLFVAFDFEEWEDCSDPVNVNCSCGQIDCGSRAYVSNFTKFYNGSLRSQGKLAGAIIMDTMLNYNTTPNSQEFPPEVKNLLPEIYQQMATNEFRGDFLFGVGRSLDDAALLDLFYFYHSLDSGKVTRFCRCLIAI